MGHLLAPAFARLRAFALRPGHGPSVAGPDTLTGAPVRPPWWLALLRSRRAGGRRGRGAVLPGAGPAPEGAALLRVADLLRRTDGGPLVEAADGPGSRPALAGRTPLVLLPTVVGGGASPSWSGSLTSGRPGSGSAEVGPVVHGAAPVRSLTVGSRWSVEHRRPVVGADGAPALAGPFTAGQAGWDARPGAPVPLGGTAPSVELAVARTGPVIGPPAGTSSMRTPSQQSAAPVAPAQALLARRRGPLVLPGTALRGPVLSRLEVVLDRVAPAAVRRSTRRRTTVAGETAGDDLLAAAERTAPSRPRPAASPARHLAPSTTAEPEPAGAARHADAPMTAPDPPGGVPAGDARPAHLATALRALLRRPDTAGGAARGPGGASPTLVVVDRGPTVASVDVLSSSRPRPLGARSARWRSAATTSVPAPASAVPVGEGSVVPLALRPGAPPRRLRPTASLQASASAWSHPAGVPGSQSETTQDVPLVRAPGRGPVVSGPHAPGELRVLGTGTVAGPAAGGFDPAGAVRVQPRPASPVEALRSPEERWNAAVAVRPLSPAVPLPPALSALARRITGRDTTAYTTGPATRAALRAAGARGATTGLVVHLPEEPTVSRASTGLLAHELAHTRSPVLRPRFLLAGHDSSPDSDERAALDAGTRAAQDGPHSAGLVDELPVGGAAGGVAEIARRAVRAALAGAAGGPPGAPSAGPAALGPTDGAAATSLDAAPDDSASAGAATAVARPGGASSGAPAAASPGGAQGGPAAAAALPDMDRLVEALEQRLLVELERRGGRWAGVF